MKRKLETKRGITLITLVITIILLLILATVAINLAVDSDGLFGKAKKATTDHNTAVEVEGMEINNLLNMLETMTKCSHTWEDGICSKCGEVCEHVWKNGVCSNCGFECNHTWSDGVCGNCGLNCSHTWNEGTCSICSKVCTHTWVDGNCSVCGMQGVSTVIISGEDTVKVKSTTTLTASYNVGTPEAGEIEWTSSNPEVATVDQNGVVTGVCSTKGTTTIKATYLKNNSVYGEKEITVEAAAVACEMCSRYDWSSGLLYCSVHNDKVYEDIASPSWYHCGSDSCPNDYVSCESYEYGDTCETCGNPCNNMEGGGQMFYTCGCSNWDEWVSYLNCCPGCEGTGTKYDTGDLF